MQRHEAAGLVIFGKTATPEFGLSATTESLAHGLTRNPWNLEHSPGGSSRGSAAAVASGVVPAAHASDGGGSIRIPSSACGLFGLKPSRGRVPMGPVRTESAGGMSVNNAVTRSVRDSAALLDATHGIEPGSRYSAPSPAGTFLSHVGREPARLRVGLMLAPVSGTPVDDQCINAARSAAALCESLGHSVEEISLTIDAGAIGQANFALVSTAVAADLDAQATATGSVIDTNVIEPITLAFYQIGKTMPGTAVARANVTMQNVAVAVARATQDFDIILSSTLAAPPVELGQYGLDNADIATWGRAVSGYTPFTVQANPACPCLLQCLARDCRLRRCLALATARRHCFFS